MQNLKTFDVSIKDIFYLSEKTNIQKALKITNLSLDELELIVGRFNKNSTRSGQLRGEIVQKLDDSITIRHHFTKKILWVSE